MLGTFGKMGLHPQEKERAVGIVVARGVFPARSTTIISKRPFEKGRKGAARRLGNRITPAIFFAPPSVIEV